MYPERFNAKTNGITPRRWLLCCNQELAQLIGEKIGMDWATDLDKLRALAAFADDPDFRQRWRGIKRLNKEKLAAIIKKRCNGLPIGTFQLSCVNNSESVFPHPALSIRIILRF